MHYRPEIDGLRAVAVVPVILFHAGIEPFSGGFIGVDVFFVISGYLITTILINDLEGGRFSLLKFYERRARRILPALFFVIAVCIPFAWLWMLPSEFEDFGRSLIAVPLFVSNILFWQDTDYFAQAAELKPLLHTWSLAVEEQYYLLFPVFLWAFWWLGRRRLALLIVVLALFSLGLAHWAAPRMPVANFYLLPTRAWELFAGSIAAFLALRAGPGLTGRIGDVAGLFGLAMICVAIFVFDKTTPFPSLFAVLPVGGTVLVILFAQGRSPAARLLSIQPLVGIGLISYSAYLWHQPLFAFARLTSLTIPDPAVMGGLVALTLVLAMLSWRCVERPFRHGQAQVFSRRSVIFGLSGLASLVLIGVGGWSIGMQGNLYRYSPQAMQVMTQQTYGGLPPGTEPLCLGHDYPDVTPVGCILGDASAQRSLAVVGDSHALQWVVALDEIGKNRNIRVELYAKSACSVAQISYYYPTIQRDYVECPVWRSAVFDLLAQTRPDLVVLTHATLGYVIDEITAPVYLAGLEDTLSTLTDRGLTTLYVQDNPRFEVVKGTRCYQRLFLTGRAEEIATLCAIDRTIALNPDLRRAEAALAQPHAGLYVEGAADLFCDSDHCFAGSATGPWMRDNNHLSAYGVDRLKPRLEEMIVTTLPR